MTDTSADLAAGDLQDRIDQVADDLVYRLVPEAYPKPLDHTVVRAADVIVTMGCGDACPYYAGTSDLDWEVNDPVGAAKQQVRAIVGDIQVRITALLHNLLVKECPAR